MPGTQSQKLKLLYLMKILLERTDLEHPITMPAIIAALAQYDITAERKSIYANMELLREFGLDIETRKAKAVGYFIENREFELAELKLLVDAVQSSHFITSKKSTELIQKLSALTSRQQAKKLQQQVYIYNQPKTLNESVYYTVDAIHSAITDGRKITFQYFDYNIKKERVYRREGTLYCQTPMALCWSDDKYYLICYNPKYDSFTHYRVDRMSRVALSEEPADKPEHGRFNIAEYAKRVFGMYGGSLVRATLQFDGSLVNTVLDKFGTQITMHPAGEKFRIHVEVLESPVFLSWMFQFGDKAEILAPDSLRAAMQALLAQQNTVYL